MKRALAIAAFVSLSAVAILGLPILLSGSHHHSCPLLTGQAVLCESTTLEHMSLFEAMLIGLLTFVLVHITRVFSALLITRRFYRPPDRAPHRRPTLMQLLYSRGILNRRESP